MEMSSVESGIHTGEETLIVSLRMGKCGSKGNTRVSFLICCCASVFSALYEYMRNITERYLLLNHLFYVAMRLCCLGNIFSFTMTTVLMVVNFQSLYLLISLLWKGMPSEEENYVEVDH